LAPFLSWLNPVHIFTYFFFEDAKQSKLSHFIQLNYPGELTLHDLNPASDEDE
jgi:hypothetical protein